MSQQQSILAREQQDVLILEVQLSKITQYEAAQSMERALIEAAQASHATKVIVDLDKVEFMSSVGYMPFIGLRKSVHEAGGRLVLCNLNEMIKEMFDTTRLLINPSSPNAPFEYAESPDGALRLLADDR